MSQETSSKPDSTHKPYPETEPSSEQAGKVAESAVATYAVRSEPQWKVPSRTIAGLATDDEVWTFVKANDLLPHLETAINLVREMFPKLHAISLRFAPDPEIPFFDSIVIDIKVDATLEEMLEKHRVFLHRSGKLIPSEFHHKIILIPGFV